MILVLGFIVLCVLFCSVMWYLFPQLFHYHLSKDMVTIAILFSFIGFLIVCIFDIVTWNDYIQLQAHTAVTIEECEVENKQISKEFAELIAISNKYSDASEQIDSSVSPIVGIQMTSYKDDDNVKAELKQYYQNRKTIRECKKQDSKLRYYRKLLAIR